MIGVERSDRRPTRTSRPISSADRLCRLYSSGTLHAYRPSEEFLMASSDLRKLRQRWLANTDGQYAVNLHEKTSGFTKSPFGEFEGQLDFRGLPFTPGVDLANLTVANANFSGSTLHSVQVTDVALVDCKLDSSEFNGVDFSGSCRISGTSFYRAAIANTSHIGSRIERCSFRDTRWKSKGNSFVNTTLNGCVFEGSMKTFDFGQARLEDCKFKGDLYDVTFHGWCDMFSPRFVQTNGETTWLDTPFEIIHNKMDHVDFSEANLSMTTLFDFCYLHRTYLPPRDTHCVFERSQFTFDEVLAAIRAEFSKPIAEKLIEHVTVFYRPHPSVPHAVLNINDFESSLADDIRLALFEIFARATEKLGTRLVGLKR
jgi:uncharacterized protein YjbI with pentapeptide repeats